MVTAAQLNALRTPSLDEKSKSFRPMLPESAAEVVRQLIAVTGPSTVAVHGGGRGLLNALRDETIEAVSVDTPTKFSSDSGVLLLAGPALSIDDVAGWLAVSRQTVAITGFAGAEAIALNETVRRLGWSRHPRSCRSPGLLVFVAASEGADSPDDTLQIYDLITNFARPGDRIGGIGLPSAGREILIANSLAAEIVPLSTDTAPLSAMPPSVNLGCLIVHAETLANAAERLRTIAMKGDRVEPGGRLILIGDADEDHAASIQLAVAELADTFIAERAFSISGGVIVERTVGRDDSSQLVAGTVVLILMRDPLAPGDPPVDRMFFVPDDPDFHVANFARDYSHPALVKAVVVRGMRLSSHQVLLETIRRLIPKTEPGGVDRGALLCTLAYQLLTDNDAEDAEFSSVVAEIGDWIAAQQQAKGHRLRWLVSLTSVKMKIEKRLGDFDAALATAERCAAIDPVPFSPLLASRTVEALFTAANIRLVRGQTEQAVGLLDRAIPLVREALGGNWLNIVGDPAHPLTFGLPEVALLARFAAPCAALRTYITQFAQRPGMVWAQALALSADATAAERISEIPVWSASQVRDFAGEFYRLTQEASQASAVELARLQVLLEESQSELEGMRAELCAFPPRLEALRQRENAYRTRVAAMRAVASARTREAQETAEDLARLQASLEASRAEFAATKAELAATKAELAATKAELAATTAELAATTAELAAFPPLIEALRERERSDRKRMAMMREEASARVREANAIAAELALSKANEESARKAVKAAQLDARTVRQRLSETFERLADAERRAALVSDRTTMES